MEYQKLIETICKEEDIDYTLISEGWISVLTKNNITKCISGYKYPLNDHALGNVIDDKFALYDLCKKLSIPIIEHRILFNPTSRLGKNTPNLLVKYFEEFNCDVVIKPNNGTEGTDVYHITTIEELQKVVANLFINNFSISICPFYVIQKEYRVVVLDNTVKLIYEKIKPVVIGDGKGSLRELLLNLNKFYFENKLVDDKYDLILKSGKVYEYDWRFNLSRGATAKLVTDEILRKELGEFATNVTRKIGAKFVSVDIILSNNKYYLMEVNSGVCINKVCNFIDQDYKLTKEIYKAAIKKMFENNC